ncbi:hypothetical protein ACFQX6_54455 [Streptosporangium lutulentum]
MEQAQREGVLPGHYTPVELLTLVLSISTAWASMPLSWGRAPQVIATAAGTPSWTPYGGCWWRTARCGRRRHAQVTSGLARGGRSRRGPVLVVRPRPALARGTIPRSSRPESEYVAVCMA